MTIKAMKQALEALENTTPTGFNMERDKQFYAAITALRHAIAEAEKQEPVAQAWDEGYRAGINDDRMSEANIGIAGFNAKVDPARNNPYRITPQPQREWVGLTDEDAVLAEREACARVCDQFIDEMQKVLPVEKLRETDPYKAFYKANAARIIQNAIRTRANT